MTHDSTSEPENQMPILGRNWQLQICAILFASMIICNKETTSDLKEVTNNFKSALELTKIISKDIKTIKNHMFKYNFPVPEHASSYVLQPDGTYKKPVVPTPTITTPR